MFLLKEFFKYLYNSNFNEPLFQEGVHLFKARPNTFQRPNPKTSKTQHSATSAGRWSAVAVAPVAPGKHQGQVRAGTWIIPLHKLLWRKQVGTATGGGKIADVNPPKLKMKVGKR